MATPVHRGCPGPGSTSVPEGAAVIVITIIGLTVVVTVEYPQMAGVLITETPDHRCIGPGG